MGWLREAGVCAGAPSSQRVCACTQGFTNACVLMILENSLLVEPAKRKVAALFLSLGKNHRFLGTGLDRRDSWHEQMEEANTHPFTWENL